MKPITEQRRQEIIEHAKEMLELMKSYSSNNGYSARSIQVIEIALASLTAVQVGKVNRGEVSDDNEYPHAKVECVHPHADWNNFKDGFALYTAPPVPVIKFPGEFSEKTNSEYQLGKEEGWYDHAREIKHLNGIK